jgi:hypothetical protein
MSILGRKMRELLGKFAINYLVSMRREKPANRRVLED